MFTVNATEEFSAWLSILKDQKGKAKILGRITRLGLGNPGKVAPVGEGISEMKIDFGPGYRVYYKQAGTTIYLLLCGGDKDSQGSDIKKAKMLAAE